MPPEALPTLDQIVADLQKKEAPEVPNQDAEEEVPPPYEEDYVVDVTGAVDPDMVGKPATAPKTEVKVPEKGPKASAFAAIQRKEKETRALVERMEQMGAELDRRQAQIEAAAADLEAKESRLKAAKRPMDVLKEYGFSYQDATQEVLGGYTEKEVDPVDAKLQEAMSPLQQRLDELDRKSKDLDTLAQKLKSERDEMHRSRRVSEVMEAARAGGFEYVEKLGDEAATLVLQVQDAYLEKNKKQLNYDEACGIVETYYESYAEKFSSTSKVKSRFVEPAQKPTPTQKSQKSSEAKESDPGTLTNSLSQGSRAKPNVDDMLPHEARAYLASQIRFTPD